MTYNQTNNQTTSNTLDDLPRCLTIQYPEPLKHSCVHASLNGHFINTTLRLKDVERWENCASFTANGNPGFMMRGRRGYISMIIENGQVIFLGDLHFWSENAVFNSTSDLPSPHECLTAFYLYVEMMSEESQLAHAELILPELKKFLEGTRLDGFLPKPELTDIAPKFEQLVLNKFTEFNLIFAEYDFSLEYGGNFITGSLNKHTFEITRNFNGLNMAFDVVITSKEHLNLTADAKNRVKITLS